MVDLDVVLDVGVGLSMFGAVRTAPNSFVLVTRDRDGALLPTY